METENNTEKVDEEGMEQEYHNETIVAANKAAERLEKANEESQRILNETKELTAQRIISGKGEVQEEEEKEEVTPKEYAKMVMAGELNG